MAMDRMAQSHPHLPRARTRHYLPPRDIRCRDSHPEGRTTTKVDKEMGFAFETRGKGEGPGQILGEQFDFTAEDDCNRANGHLYHLVSRRGLGNMPRLLELKAGSSGTTRLRMESCESPMSRYY